MRTSMKPNKRTRGIVLPLSLVMLLMVTLIAVVAIRGVTTEERIAANLRSSSVAFEAAEIALRHCETIVRTGAAGGVTLANIRIDSDSAAKPWTDESRWTASSTSPLTAERPQNVSAPQCMVEDIRVGPGEGAVSACRGPCPSVARITARGYGDNAGGFRTVVQAQLRLAP